jgi:histidinol dehydrogenase
VNRHIVHIRRDAGIVAAFLKRTAFDDKVEAVARRVLDEVRRHGDKAVLKYADKFDGMRITKGKLRVSPGEILAALRSADRKFLSAARAVRRRIERFARAGQRENWYIPTGSGGRLGEVFVPLDRVGVYVPGGAAPLASTALMTAALARAAGVKEIVACTPSGHDGKLNPYLLSSLHIAGATEIYRVGGIQSIGMMAFGTASVDKVQKIVGPGGAYVTSAKRMVYGHVALDLVAGPSEIAVLADSAANPAHVAADLLSQAEHGTGLEKVLLVTTSSVIAGQTLAEWEKQAARLSRRKAIDSVLRNGLLFVVVDSLAEGVDLCNRFAPEHLELQVAKPRALLPGVRCAGAVFLGRWTPESAGDFAAGPSHVLPTGGAASMFAGLTVDDFRRRMSVIEYSRRDLELAMPIIEAFGRVEGLDAHTRSAVVRFSSK